MVWARLDDEILDNEKIIKAGPLGFALHVAAITWCCRNLTDGFIPRSKVRALLDFEGVGVETARSEMWAYGSDADGLAIGRSLVAIGLWLEDDERGGFWIHDFLDYNPSREKVLAERERGKVRAKASHARPKQRPSSFVASPEDTSKIRRKIESVSDGPDPVPVPKEIPPTPQGERDQTVPLGTAIAIEVEDTYQRSVSALTERPYALTGRTDRTALMTAVNKHCPERAPDKILAWLAQHTSAWVAPRLDAPEYAGNFAPKHFLGWLNAGAKPPSSLQRLTGTDDASTRPSRQPFREDP